MEKVIYLEGIDPLSFYGVNNSRLNILTKGFPKLKIIARGNEIKVIGEKKGIDQFETKVDIIAAFLHKYNTITEHDLENLLEDDLYHSNGKEDMEEILLYSNTGKPIKARTTNQQKLVQEYDTNDLLFAIGPAGSGKTYTAIALAVRALKNKEVKRIILTRPAVEAGERLGFLPGDYKEKLDPYLQPLYDALNDMIPARKLMDFIEEGTVQIAPLAFMRGRTLDQAFVILDEAQNTTINQLKMFLTRMGKNAKFIVTGDITQIDLPYNVPSGLIQGMKILENIEGIGFVYFDEKDIIRHRLVKDIVKAYEKVLNRNDKAPKK